MALEVKLEKAKTFNEDNPVYRVVLEKVANGVAATQTGESAIKFSPNADRLGEQMRRQFEQKKPVSNQD